MSFIQNLGNYFDIQKEISHQADFLFSDVDYVLKFDIKDDRSFTSDLENIDQKRNITIGMRDVLFGNSDLFDKMVALRHEYKHVCQQEQLFNGDGDNITSYSFISKTFANGAFYYANYWHLPMEIEAEAFGVKAAHRYVCDTDGIDKADECVLNYIHKKLMQGDARYCGYNCFDKCVTVDDVWNAFDDAYDQSCQKHVVFDNFIRFKHHNLTDCVYMLDDVIDEYKCIASYEMMKPENKLYIDMNLSVIDFETYKKAYSLLTDNSDINRLSKAEQRCLYSDYISQLHDSKNATIEPDIPHDERSL